MVRIYTRVKQMNCKGCDGQGTYQLLGPVKVCDRCHGSKIEPTKEPLEVTEDTVIITLEEGRELKREGDMLVIRNILPPRPRRVLPGFWLTTPDTEQSSSSLAEAIKQGGEARENFQDEGRAKQLAQIHTSPSGKLVEAVKSLHDPLPQVVFEPSHLAFLPSPFGWWWKNPRHGWLESAAWGLTGVCATPGPKPADDAPVLRIETQEELVALVERYAPRSNLV